MLRRIFLLCFLLILGFSHADAQRKRKCKVKHPSLQENYSGDCKSGYAWGKGEASGTDTYVGRFKKGMPHGKGTYIWHTGEIYKGEWKKGMRHGEGTYRFTYDGKDTINEGIWKKDIYKGSKKIAPYKVLQKRNVEKYDISKAGDKNNRVYIDFKQLGMRNTTITNLNFITNSGSETGSFRKIFDMIDFPFECTIRYTTSNKLKNGTYDVLFNFVINEPGNWFIVLEN